MIGEEPQEDIVIVALDAAESFISTRLAKFNLNIPSPTPKPLKSVAQYYATAEVLQTLFNPNTESSKGVDWYLERADMLLDDYIKVVLGMNHKYSNPYSSSQTPAFKDDERWL